MANIFAFFVSNWRFSFLMTLMIALMGLLGLGILQRETFPPVNFATVSVVTIYPGATPEDVYDRVTRIIESELRGTTGLKDVKSVSQSGRSTITIRIDIDRPDPQEIVNEIQRAVTRAKSLLPTEVLDAPLVTEVKAKEIPVIELALVGPNENRERDRYVEDLKEVFDDVRGVASVRYSGYIERELQILLDREKLQRLNVGISEVANAMKARLRNIPAGSLETTESTTLVRLVGQSGDPKEIQNLVIRSNDSGILIRISDVGRVIESAKRPTVLARVNSEPATLMIVTKKEEVDSITVVDALTKKIEGFAAKLPANHKIVIYNDEGRRIKNRLEIVQFNAVFGLLAVLGILFVFLPGKVGLFSSLSLPICALGTVAFMVYLGANFNIITMIAIVICLGNLVDNSVVVSEHYTTLRENGVAAKEAAIKSAEQFWIPFTASTITIIAAFLPMLVTEGVLGQFIKWIPIVVSIALVLSLVEALTLLPARLQFLETQKKPKTGTEIKKAGPSVLETFFGDFVRWTANRRYITAAIMTALVVSGVFVTALFNRFELFPADGVEYYVARFESPPQMGIAKVDSASAALSRDVAAVLGDDVESVIARSGIQQVGAGDPQSKSGDNVGFLLIRIKNDRYLQIGIEDTLKKLRGIRTPPELSKVVFETIQGGPPVGKPVTVTLRSTNTSELVREAKEFQAELAKVPGLRNVETDLVEAGREYSYKPNDERIALVGLNLDLIGLNLRAAIEGLSIAQLTDRGLEYDVTVKYDAKDREDVEDIQLTRVTNSSGNQTSLNLIGQISETNAPSVIRGYDFRRSITVTGDINETAISSGRANAEARKILEQTMHDAKSTSTVFGGVDESTKDSLKSLGIALVLSIIGIFATLVFTFKSYSKPFIILSSIPLGLVGVLYSFALNQRPLSFLAFIGVVGLSGVVINSAIILVDFIEELRRENVELGLIEILVQASQKRLRAVLATGLTTVVGLLPTAFGIGGNDPLLIPITLALSWGMIIGTVLSLVWIPSAYLILEDFIRLTRAGAQKALGLFRFRSN